MCAWLVLNRIQTRVTLCGDQIHGIAKRLGVTSIYGSQETCCSDTWQFQIQQTSLLAYTNYLDHSTTCVSRPNLSDERIHISAVMEGKGSDSTATGVEKERTRGKTGTSITAVKQTNAHASSEDHQIPPQSAFLVVTLVAIQLALQTDQLTPLFNSYPLARWPRWAGIAAVIFLSSLVRVGDSLHLLLTMAALTCAFSACMGRDLGSRIGRDLGPEYAPALVSVILALGGLIAAGRVAVVS